MRVIPVLASAVLACGLSLAASTPENGTTFPLLDVRTPRTVDYTPADAVQTAAALDLNKKLPDDPQEPGSFCPTSFCNEPGVRCIRTSDTGSCCTYEITFDFTCETGARPPGVCPNTCPYF